VDKHDHNKSSADGQIIFEDLHITEDNMLIHLGYLRRDVCEIKRNLDSQFVKKDEFTPIKRLVYGFVGLVGTGLLAFILKIISLIFSVKGS